MVCDNIHNHLYAAFVGLLHIGAEEFVASETGINVIIVCTSIAMVGVLRLIVLKQRSAPYRCDAESRDVVEMVNDALKVTAMTAEELVAMHFVAGLRSTVVRRVSVCEAVRHDKIYQVLGCKAFTLSGTFAALCDFVWLFESFAVFGKYEPIGSRLCRRGYPDIQEEEVWIVSLMYLSEFHSVSTLYCHLIHLYTQ